MTSAPHDRPGPHEDDGRAADPDRPEPIDPLEGLMDPDEGENSPTSDAAAPPPS
jgi:hypothetical protein